MQILIAIGNQNQTCAATDGQCGIVAITRARCSSSPLPPELLKTPPTPTCSTSLSATFTFVDLAGSERARRAVQTSRQSDSTRAPLSQLVASCIGNCINALCDPRRHKHVPYRDSKLTRLLKFSWRKLSNRMIACVSLLSHHYDETLNNFKYADRAKRISTKW